MSAGEQIIYFDEARNQLNNINDDSSFLNGSSSSSVESAVIESSQSTIKLFPTNHTSGSSDIVMKNITNYAWIPVDIPGTLIDVHCLGDYIAYALQGKDPYLQGGMIRIIRSQNSHRGLIKNIPGSVTDLAFAFIKEKVLVACVDKFGSFIVHEIFDEDQSLRVELLIEVKEFGGVEQTKWWPVSDNQRVVWCPYIPEDNEEPTDAEDDDDNAYLVAVTNGKCAEIWDLGTVLQSVTGSISRSSVRGGYQLINEHAGDVTCIVFSPDGTALATASLDGIVNFYQLDMKSDMKSPRCIHQWNPHEGKAISSLFFLDDYKHPGSEGLWKCAVTGANNNTEFKLWSCSNWICLQKVCFSYEENDFSSPISLKAAIDSSSKFVVLSDANRRALYILILDQRKAEDNCVGQEKDSSNTIKFVSVSQLPVQNGISFLSIRDASYKPYKRWKHHLHDGEADDCEERNDIDIVEGLVIQCFTITSKSLSEATIRFQPMLPSRKPDGLTEPIQNVSTSQDSVGFEDGLTDVNTSFAPISIPIAETAVDCNVIHEKETSLQVGETEASPSKTNLLLLTPESFNPGRIESKEVGLQMGNEIRDELGTVDVEEDLVHIKPIDAVMQPILPCSSASSPSLEVQQILLSQNDKSEDFFEGALANVDASKENEMCSVDVLSSPMTEDVPGSLSTTTSPCKTLPIWNHCQSMESPTTPLQVEQLPQIIPKDPVLQQLIDGLGAQDNLNELDGASSQSPTELDPKLPSVSDLRMIKNLSVNGSSSLTDSQIFVDTVKHPILLEQSSRSPPSITPDVPAFDKKSERLEELTKELEVLKDTVLSKSKEHKERLNQLNNQNKVLEHAVFKTLHAIEKLSIKMDRLTGEQKEHKKSLLLLQKNPTDVRDIISAEMKISVIPTLNKNFESLRMSLSNQSKSTTLTAKSVGQISEQLSQSLVSKKFTEQVAASMTKTMLPSVQASTKKCYSEVLLPGMQQCFQSTLAQVDESFKIGTSEYLDKVDAECSAIRTDFHDTIKKGAANLDAVSHTITAKTQSLSESLGQTMAHYNGMNEFMEAKLRAIVREEMAKAIREQLTTGNESRRTSRSHTPMTAGGHPSTNLKALQQTIQTMIENQDFNGAFKQALMVSDLSLVVFVCERVNPQQLFNNTSCPLSPEVLLSLINQLAHDLSTYTDLKMKFLEDAIMTLDLKHPVTKEYVGRILIELQQSLQTHLSLHPNLKKLKMLLLAVNQLILQIK